MALNLKRKAISSAHMNNSKKEQRTERKGRPTNDSDTDEALLEHTPFRDHENALMDEDVEDGGEGEGGGEEDEWGGIGLESVVRPDRHPRQEGADFNKFPTRNEIRTMKEASDLFKSNSFKLQIDELLPNVRPKESRIQPLDEFLLVLYSFLVSLPSTAPAHPLTASQKMLKQGIAVPYPVPPPNEDTNWKVGFEKPTDITLVGSWANKVGARGSGNVSWTVDVALEMPSTLFQEKDYLDGRFFHKKAYYIASLASALTTTKTFNVDAQYECPSSDTRLTTLVLIPKKDGSPTDFSKLNARVRLMPVLPNPSPIALQHLSPSHCNLRIKLADEGQAPPAVSTPIYNTALLTCTTARPHLLQTHELVKDVPSFRDALALLRVWANQRGFCPGSENQGCVLGFEGRGYFWTALMTVLVIGEEPAEQKPTKRTQRKTVGRGLSSYQLFRAALDFLAKHDFGRELVMMKGGLKFKLEHYKAHHETVFVDSSSVNLLAGVPLASLDLLRQDAKITLDLLNSGSSSADPFSDVFLRDQRLLSTRFDIVLGIDLRAAALRKPNHFSAVDHGSPSQYLLHSLSSILGRALGDRVKAVSVFAPTNDTRPLTQASGTTPFPKVHVGLMLDPVNAFRLVDHGPGASEQDGDDATIFREFWGDKAELRRFKDGRITESVVWDVKTSDERARIPSLIVLHVLERHFGLDGERDMQTIQRDFDDVVRIPDSLAPMFRAAETQLGFKGALAACDNLVKQLKGLDEEIPLAILNVSPITSELRYTSVFAPLPLSAKVAKSLPTNMRYLSSMEIIIQFESSGRWPDSLVAIQKMKLAFFEQIANALMLKVTGLKAIVIVGDGLASSEISDEAYLQILTADGWAFSCRIWHDREGTLLERLLGQRNSLARGVAQSSPEGAEKRHAMEAYRLYQRRFIHSPKHHRAVGSLCHRFPAYAGTVRLMKRWLSSHWLLGEHISEEVVELLCAVVFVGDSKEVRQQIDDDRTGIPGTKELGFFRVVSFLKEWKWESGLFVSLYDADMSDKGGAEVAPVHLKAGSGGVWAISTSEDPEGHIWTSQGPSLIVARRVKALATSAMSYIHSQERAGLIAKALFLHPTEDYDFLIHLKKGAICRYQHTINADFAASREDQKYANLPPSSSNIDEPLRIDFDPVALYVKDLKRIYAGTLEFFHDIIGGVVIGAVWDPSVLVARPFRVLADYSSMPITMISEEKSKQNYQVQLNQHALLSEIQRLGDGLVDSIQIQQPLLS